jgi:outer membrane immunogenic protein
MILLQVQRKMKGRIMRRIIFTSSLATAAMAATALANAADLRPTVMKAPPAPVYYNWTGFYLGANLGGSWGRESHETFDGTAGVFEAAGTNHPDGVIGGGQIGYNWQFAPWFGWGTGTVLGIEADFQGSSQRSTMGVAFSDPRFGPVSFAGSDEDKLEWFGTVRGRAGIAFDRVLWYTTGGWAYGERKIDGPLTSSNAAGVIASTAFSNSNSMDGWTVGGGVEWAFWGNWTAKFEYLYIDFSSPHDVAIPGGPFVITSGHFIDNIARAGVNYKF